MESIIVAVLFVALMACWVFLPGQGESGHVAVAAEPVAGVKATTTA